MAHPLFTVPLFIASLYGVYFTPLFDALMGNPVGHQLMLAHFVVVGLLFFGPIVAQDPWPRTLSHPGRMLELFLPVPFHAFFGVAIMMAGSLVVDDLRRAAGRLGRRPARPTRAWPAASSGPSASCRPCWCSPSSSSPGRAPRSAAAGRIDRAADRTHDAELAAYNARLRALAERQLTAPDDGRRRLPGSARPRGRTAGVRTT